MRCVKKSAKNMLFAVVIFGVFFVLMMGAVSAQGGGLARAVETIGNQINGIVDALTPVLKTIAGDVSGVGSFSSGDILFAKVLIFLLLMALVYVIAERMPVIQNAGWVIWTLAIIIPLLAVRFITSETILFMVMPSSAFGVAITSLLPLVLYFVFVETSGAIDSPTLRKIAWALAACVFAGLYFSRFDAIGDLAWAYLAAAGLSVLILLLDGTIQKVIHKARFERFGHASMGEMEREIRRKIAQANQDLRSNIISSDEHKRIISELKKSLEYVLKTKYK